MFDSSNPVLLEYLPVKISSIKHELASLIVNYCLSVFPGQSEYRRYQTRQPGIKLWRLITDTPAPCHISTVSIVNNGGSNPGFPELEKSFS